MRCAESRELWRKRHEEMIARLLALSAGIDEKTLNTTADASLWSPAQVVEHLVLTNRPYLNVMAAVLKTAGRGAVDAQVRYSVIGGILCKAAGPDGNAPAPKALHPRTTSIPLTIVEEWRQQETELLGLLDQSTGVDLSRIRVWNPLVRFLPMNLADCFAILTAHTERHVGQIQARLPPAQKRNAER
jgi:hypothetical protein